MFETVEFLANIATILGFSIDFTKNRDKSNYERDVLLQFIRKVTINTQNIKIIHQKYHALSSDMRIISALLGDQLFYDKLRKGDKKLRLRLKEILQSGNINISQTQLRHDLAPCFIFLKKIKYSTSDQKLSLVENLAIQSAILRIKEAQEKLEEQHLKLVTVLEQIHKFTRANWGDSEYDYILENCDVFIIYFFAIVDSADVILMGYLTILDEILRTSYNNG